MGRDEVGTLSTLNRYRAIIDPLIASHRGRIFTTAGDSLVADFASPVDAVQCAVEIQEAIGKENADRSAEKINDHVDPETPLRVAEFAAAELGR